MRLFRLVRPADIECPGTILFIADSAKYTIGFNNPSIEYVKATYTMSVALIDFG